MSFVRARVIALAALCVSACGTPPGGRVHDAGPTADAAVTRVDIPVIPIGLDAYRMWDRLPSRSKSRWGSCSL